MKNIELENWETEVKQYLNKINIELQTSKQAKDLYYGFDVIDGKLKQSPEILFIGINPGHGNEERHYEVKFKSERISYLDYFDNEYNYPLARETVNVFRLIGLTDDEIISKLENQCVKTNLYHIITDNDRDIKKCFNVSNVIKFDDYYKKSIDYSISLIKAIQPKIVILEGKSVYDYIIADCYEQPNTWNKNLGFGHYFSEKENIHFIGYKRIFSNILMKENIAEKLKEII